MPRFTEDDSIDATVTGPSGIQHISYDAVDIMESGTTLDDIVAELKEYGYTKVVLEITFGDK